MLLQRERELIVDYGKKLLSRGMTRGTGGNLSIYRRDAGLVAMSPSALDYGKLQPVDIPVIALDRTVVEGHAKVSSEADMHLTVYRTRDDLNAVVHTHSVFASTLSCLHWDLPPVHYLLGCAGGDVRCAAYATVASLELADSAVSAMQGRKAVLLANHGLLAGGLDMHEAFTVAELVEFCAEVYYRSKCAGEPAVIPEHEMNAVLEKFKTYGQ